MASGLITSWQIDGERMEIVINFIFLGSKITADGDFSHEMKRCLLLGRKAMTNLDSILKSRDITLLTKVYHVKTIVSPVVLYLRENWIIKSAECRRIDVFGILALEKTLESLLGCKEVKAVNPKGNQSWIFIERLMLKLKLEYFGHVMWRTNSLEIPWCDVGKDWRWEKRTTEDEMVGWHCWLNGHEFEQAPRVGIGLWSLMCYSPKSRTLLSDWTELNWKFSYYCRQINSFAGIFIDRPFFFNTQLK